MKEKIINILIFIPAVLLPTALLFIVAIGFEFVGVQKPFELAYWIFLLLTSPIWIMIAYKFLKDIHQSNLDDIEEQQLEEQIDQTVVKEQMKTLLETAALFSLILYLLMCGVLFVFAPDLGLVNWLILLSVIPAILLIGKIVSTIKDMRKNYLDNNEEREATIIK